MYDLLIKNAEIMNGTGSKAYISDVAVKDGKIARIAENITETAEKVIDAAGLTLTPGFIDSHSHADSDILSNLGAENLLEQGITTVMSGQCGHSAAPSFDEDDTFHEKRTSVKTYFDTLDKEGAGINVSLLVGHANVRDASMGTLANRAPTDAELANMKKLVAEALEQGANGMNSGTYYTPCAYASTDEVIALCQTVKEYGGAFDAHIRSESVRLIEAVQEMIDIARATGVTTVISHHKAAGGPNYWGLSAKTLPMIERARAEGVNIFCDVYPYNACSTSLWATFISKERQALGKKKITEMLKTPEYRAEAREWIEETFIRHSWHEKGLSWCMMTKLKKMTEFNGLRINEAAAKYGKDEFETLFDVLVANDCGGNSILFTMNEEDVERIISAPYAMIGTDASSGNSAHPRYYGTFPRVLGHYVRERQLDSFEHMIHRMTGLPATVYKMTGKGFILEGFDADFCIFDKNTIGAGSTFAEPNRKNIGLHYVIVNGVVAVKDCECTGSRSGKTVRRK